MKKLYLLMVLFVAAAFSLSAQTVVFSDNFDSYTAGAYLAQSNSAWTTWDNAPGTSQDGVISSAQAASAPNSLYITGSNDQVYPFGNYTSGHYTLTFNYYVPSTGNGGYFNIQHILLSQWALECYFNSTGDGYLSVGGTDYNFTSPTDAWFPIEFDVDMDNNTASLTVNNVAVHTWPFNYQAGNTNGTNQLAGINFYAGAPNNASGTYYVDDFVVTEVSAALVGHFAVNPETPINVSFGVDGGTSTVEVSNPGDAPINYRIVPTYEITNVNPASTGVDTLSYCNEVYSSLGFNNGVEWEAAAEFPASQMTAHLGRTLNAINIHLGAGADDGVTNAKIRVYAMGELNSGPGDVLYEQDFTPAAGWNLVQLTTPFVLDGGDLWIGATAYQPTGVYLFSFDDMPGNGYSAWYRTGSGWNTLANLSASYNFNWCIKGAVDGTPVTPWMTVSPNTGTLNAAQTQNVTITYNTAGMSVGDVKNGTLHFFSDDYDNGVVTVDVTLSFSGVGVDDPSVINITLYPNPAVENLNITSEQIERVEIYNLNGQMVFAGTYSDSQVSIPTEGFAAGMYTVKVKTASQTTTHKIVIP
ncbi:MAG: T9SS type A sorting domain-containing protein [Bacteroidales bacterium]|nr:T9SS type A sorting domain-containing protein [Bacteroidales bacterium]